MSTNKVVDFNCYHIFTVQALVFGCDVQCDYCKNEVRLKEQKTKLDMTKMTKTIRLEILIDEVSRIYFDKIKGKSEAKAKILAYNLEDRLHGLLFGARLCNIKL